MPAHGGGESIVIVSGDAAKQGTLEFRAIASKLAAKLTAAGYRVVDSETIGSTITTYAAVLSYGIDDGTLVTSTYSIPRYGVTGYSGATTTGTISTFGNLGTYQGTTTYTPTYGITGYSTGTSTQSVYTRALILNIYDVAKLPADPNAPTGQAQVYSSKLVSSGICSSLAVVMDALLEALFRDFPGESGSARTVSVPFGIGKC